MKKNTSDKQEKKNVRIKGERITFRVTEKEKQQLKLMMETSGFNNTTDFIRYCIFDKKHDGVVITNLKKYWEQVNRHMKKIEKETLIYEQESSKNGDTDINKILY